MRPSCGRTVAAGALGGVALNLAMLLTFRIIGFGPAGDGVLLDPRIQSPKLIAVWTTLEPLPLVVSRPPVILLGLVAFAIVHAFLYRALAPAWPPGATARGVRMAGLVFVLSYIFWEFFTPFNQLGEPLPLIALELVFWAVVAAAEGLTIAAVMERPRGIG